MVRLINFLDSWSWIHDSGFLILESRIKNLKSNLVVCLVENFEKNLLIKGFTLLSKYCTISQPIWGEKMKAKKKTNILSGVSAGIAAYKSCFSTAPWARNPSDRSSLTLIQAREEPVAKDRSIDRRSSNLSERWWMWWIYPFFPHLWPSKCPLLTKKLYLWSHPPSHPQH